MSPHPEGSCLPEPEGVGDCEETGWIPPIDLGRGRGPISPLPDGEGNLLGANISNWDKVLDSDGFGRSDPVFEAGGILGIFQQENFFVDEKTASNCNFALSSFSFFFFSLSSLIFRIRRSFLCDVFFSFLTLTFF